MGMEFGLRINRPTTRFIETDTIFVIILYLSGVEKNQIDIAINEEGTQISVTRRGAGRSFHESVISRTLWLEKKLKIGQFYKVFWIPDGIVLDRIRARFDEAEEILFIYMPKSIRGRTGITIKEVDEEQDKEIADEEAVLQSEAEASDEEQSEVEYERKASDKETSESDQEEAKLESESEPSDGEQPEAKYKEVRSTEETPQQQDFEEIEIEEIISEDRGEEETSEQEKQCPEKFQDLDINSEEMQKGDVSVEEEHEEESPEEEESCPQEIQHGDTPWEEIQEEIDPDDNNEGEIPDMVEVCPEEIGTKDIPQVESEEVIAPDNDKEEDSPSNVARNNDHEEENKGPQQSCPEEIEENNVNNDHEEETRGSEEIQDDGGSKNIEEKIPEPAQFQEPEPLEKPKPENIHNEKSTFENSGEQNEELKIDREPTVPDKKLPEEIRNDEPEIDEDLERSPRPQAPETQEKEIEEEITFPANLDQEVLPQPGQSHLDESSAPTPEEEPPEAIQNEELEIPEQITSPTDIDRHDPSQPEEEKSQGNGAQNEEHGTPQAEEIAFDANVEERPPQSEAMPSNPEESPSKAIRNEELGKPEEIAFVSPNNPDQQEPSQPCEEIQSKEVELPEPTRSLSGGDDGKPTIPKAPGAAETLNPPAMAAAIGEEEDQGEDRDGEKTPGGGWKIFPRPQYSGSTILMGTAFILSLVVFMLHSHKKEKRRQ